MSEEFYNEMLWWIMYGPRCKCDRKRKYKKKEIEGRWGMSDVMKYCSCEKPTRTVSGRCFNCWMPIKKMKSK